MRNKDLGRPLSRAVTVFYFSAFLLLFLRDYKWEGPVSYTHLTLPTITAV